MRNKKRKFNYILTKDILKIENIINEFSDTGNFDMDCGYEINDINDFNSIKKTSFIEIYNDMYDIIYFENYKQNLTLCIAKLFNNTFKTRYNLHVLLNSDNIPLKIYFLQDPRYLAAGHIFYDNFLIKFLYTTTHWYDDEGNYKFQEIFHELKESCKIYCRNDKQLKKDELFIKYLYIFNNKLKKIFNEKFKNTLLLSYIKNV